jgi:hypothetical protein
MGERIIEAKMQLPAEKQQEIEGAQMGLDSEEIRVAKDAKKIDSLAGEMKAVLENMDQGPVMDEKSAQKAKKEWLEGDGLVDDGEGRMKLKPVSVEQFVMAYRIDQDRIRAMLPEGFTSLRPVLRINTELIRLADSKEDYNQVYVEFNTPVEADGRRGWLNIANWKSPEDPLSFHREGKTVAITAPFLMLTYTGVGIEGGCPAEKDNDGCYFNVPHEPVFRSAETITENKEFCDCAFTWLFHDGDASGRSEGKTIPAFEAPAVQAYEKQTLTAENAAAIAREQVLGAYIVRFIR